MTPQPNHPSQLVESPHSDHGFTMVELLIVIVILGVLSTIVAFSVKGLTTKSHENACRTESRSLASAIEGYFGLTGVYPPADEVATAANETLAALTAEGFMDISSSRWRYPGGNPATSLVPLGRCTAADRI